MDDFYPTCNYCEKQLICDFCECCKKHCTKEEHAKLNQSISKDYRQGESNGRNYNASFEF